MILELLTTWFSNLAFEYSSKPLNIYDDHKMLEGMKSSWICNYTPKKDHPQEFLLGPDNTTVGKIIKQ